MILVLVLALTCLVLIRADAWRLQEFLEDIRTKMSEEDDAVFPLAGSKRNRRTKLVELYQRWAQ